MIERQLGLQPSRVDADQLFRKADVALCAIDGETRRLTRSNRPFASLVGRSEECLVGSELLGLFDEPDLELLHGIMGGIVGRSIDSCQARVRLAPPGHREQVVVSMLPFEHPLGNVLVALVPADDDDRTTEGGELLAATTRRLALLAVDHDWKIDELSTDLSELVGHAAASLRGRPVQSLVHPADVPLLLLALGRASADGRSAPARLRLVAADGSSIAARLEVSPLCGHQPPRYAMALWISDDDRDREVAAERARRLEGHLWRIAMELQTAELPDLPLAALATGTASRPGIKELSARQGEITERLLRGERVPAIARQLYLSESTVRNHLSVIFRKFGVHSQAELIALLVPPLGRSGGRLSLEEVPPMKSASGTADHS